MQYYTRQQMGCTCVFLRNIFYSQLHEMHMYVYTSCTYLCVEHQSYFLHVPNKKAFQ